MLVFVLKKHQLSQNKNGGFKTSVFILAQEEDILPTINEVQADFFT